MGESAGGGEVGYSTAMTTPNINTATTKLTKSCRSSTSPSPGWWVIRRRWIAPNGGNKKISTRER